MTLMTQPPVYFWQRTAPQPLVPARMPGGTRVSEVGRIRADGSCISTRGRRAPRNARRIRRLDTFESGVRLLMLITGVMLGWWPFSCSFDSV